MNDNRGAFCIVIQEQLAVANCPLPSGSCMWKHRIHGLCMYTEEFANTQFTPNDFALRVGLPPIGTDVVAILKRAVVHKLREELKDTQ